MLDTAQLEEVILSLSQAISGSSLKASILFCNVTNPIHFAPQCSTGVCNGDRKKAFLNAVIGTVNDHDTAELLCASAVVS